MTTMRTMIHFSMAMSMLCMRFMCIKMRWVCMHVRSMFSAKYGFNLLWLKAYWLKDKSKQSMFFYKTQISFLIFKKETTWAWETKTFSFEEEIFSFWTKIFFKDSFSFEIKIIYFAKNHFSFDTKSSFKDKT